MRKLASLVILLALSTATFATDGDKDKKKKKSPEPKSESKMAVMKVSDEAYKMYYVSPDEGKVRVRLYNEEGTILFSQRVRHDEGFALPYNFKNLDAGKYTFEVINADGSALRHVIRHDELIETIELASLEANVQRLEDTNRFQLLVMKPNAKEVKIKIRDESGMVIHEERVNFEKGFKRVYDLSNLDGKNYTFEIINGDDVRRLSTI